MSTLSRILNPSRRGGGESSSTDSEESQASARRFVQRADAYRRRGLYEEAIAVCLEGLSVHPNYVGGLVALARAYQFAGDVGRAVVTYERVVALAPDNIAGHLGLAEVYETVGRLGEATRHLRASIDLGADGPDVRTWLQRLVEAGHAEEGGAESLRDGTAPTHVSLAVLRRKWAVLEAYRRRMARVGKGGERGG